MEMPACKEIPDNLDEDLLRRIFEAADTKRFNDMEKREYKSAIMSEFDYGVALSEAQQDGLDEGRQEGLAEGRQEGLEKGRKLGLEEGRKLGLEEGRKEGLEEGRKEGLEEGRKEGLAEGRQKGEMAERERIAQVMKEAGVDAKVIEAATGLKI